MHKYMDACVTTVPLGSAHKVDCIIMRDVCVCVCVCGV